MKRKSRTDVGKPMDSEEQEEFNKQVWKCDEPGYQCWLWIGARAGSGYGIFNTKRGPEYAHRLSLEMKLGRPIGPGLQSAHEPIICHEPACVNPDHLREATRSENARDQDLDGTRHRVHLTDDQVRAIRADPRTQQVVAAEYGLVQSMIAHIRTRRCYKNVV
jgi:hypothetical protein